IRRSAVDRLLQLTHLGFTVAHGGDHVTKLLVSGKGVLQLPYVMRTRIDGLCTNLLRTDESCAISHATVRKGRTVFDDDDLLAPYKVRFFKRDGRSGFNDHGLGVMLLDRCSDLRH